MFGEWGSWTAAPLLGRVWLQDTESVGLGRGRHGGLSPAVLQRLDEGGPEPKDIRCSNLDYYLFV